MPRARFPAVDFHNHLGRWPSRDRRWMVADVGALLELMDSCNVASMVNLDGYWGEELEANLDRYDRAHPGRFSTFCRLDWPQATKPGGAARLEASLARSRRAGARGLKVSKELGLRWKDPRRRWLLPDDERLSPVWAAAGELGMPVLIHTADPVAFFQPVDRHNERLEELRLYPRHSVSGRRFPGFGRLIDALEAVVAANPGTTFVGAHVGCYAENLAWVSRMLSTYANFHVDISGRVAELGRQPRAARRLVLEHADRVLFGTDAFPPEAAEIAVYFRFLETADEHFPYSGADAPRQGRWAVSGLDLPDDVLRKVYRENALRILPHLGG